MAPRPLQTPRWGVRGAGPLRPLSEAASCGATEADGASAGRRSVSGERVGGCVAGDGVQASDRAGRGGIGSTASVQAVGGQRAGGVTSSGENVPGREGRRSRGP